MPKRIQSVIELARYKVGDTAFWVIIRPLQSMPELDEEDQWMDNHHPKALYTRGPGKKLWPYYAKLPRLHHMDFEGIVNLLRSELVVEPFHVCDIVRSRGTGEFFYCNGDDEWMPEEHLFDTDIAANREVNRIKRLIRKWAK